MGTVQVWVQVWVKHGCTLDIRHGRGVSVVGAGWGLSGYGMGMGTGLIEAWVQWISGRAEGYDLSVVAGQDWGVWYV